MDSLNKALVVIIIIILIIAAIVMLRPKGSSVIGSRTYMTQPDSYVTRFERWIPEARKSSTASTHVISESYSYTPGKVYYKEGSTQVCTTTYQECYPGSGMMCSATSCQ